MVPSGNHAANGKTNVNTEISGETGLLEEYARLEKIYLRVRDIEMATKEVASSFLAENPDYFLTPEIYRGVCRQIMKHIAKCVN